ncbi:DUF4058 family protein [Candidatus Entotheonella palauensis]|uniref:DUF4058 domain-containing protein n=1 Tax=Candidatus Entotheonella gemina TaxID=1429439 RepID=W4M6K0_9BACT|nr:DUF4058 family protein [Candidatus Entotheonella palauensis]ETX05566.1 MAG: hypothetical protein ETSY2_22215 [Candidatus Entotheonella gemina]
MPSPFPGMDPYLEARNIWPGFHHRLADELADRLNRYIGPKYYADVDVHTVVEDISISASKTVYPDVGVVEPMTPTPPVGSVVAEAVMSPAPIQRLVVTGQAKLRSVRVYITETDELVTAIEILSPYNKRGEGLAEYRLKRSTLLNAPVHLVEIDLLRSGRRPGPEVDDPPLDEADYILLVNRSREDDPRRISEIWPVQLSEVLPALPVPLAPPDPDVGLDLNAAIQAVYARAGYDWRLHYDQPVPPPKLRPEMADWLVQHPAD